MYWPAQQNQKGLKDHRKWMMTAFFSWVRKNHLHNIYPRLLRRYRHKTLAALKNRKARSDFKRKYLQEPAQNGWKRKVWRRKAHDQQNATSAVSGSR